MRFLEVWRGRTGPLIIVIPVKVSNEQFYGRRSEPVLPVVTDWLGWRVSRSLFSFLKRVKSNPNLKGLTRCGNHDLQAYIDNIKAKTGKEPEYFQKQAKEKVLVSHAELLSWLKSDCGLGHGHANAIILYIKDPELAKKKLVEDAKREKARK